MIDIGFNKFLTLKIIKIAWVTTIVLAALFTVVGMAYGLYGAPTELGFAEDGTPIEGGRDPIWLAVFLSPVLATVWVLFTRIGLELVGVIFKIADNTTALVARRSAPAQHPVSDARETATVTPNSENSSPDALTRDDRLIKDDLVVG